MKRIAITLAAAAAVVTLAAPAQADTIRHAEAVAKASSHASIWHVHGRGYVILSRDEMQSRAVAPGWNPRLYREWRTLNSSLWTIARAFPVCTSKLTDDCKTHAGQQTAGVVIDGRWYVANQRGRF